MTAAQNRLAGLTKELRAEWEQTKHYWNDAKSREFEKRFLEELMAGVEADRTLVIRDYLPAGRRTRTAEEALEDSPMKNLFAAMISLAGELGLSLNLGGGVTPGDSLDKFKSGFGNDTAVFRTHEVICDPVAYEELSSRAGEAPEGFFPAYRA